MKERIKNQSLLQIEHQRGHHVQISHTLYVKIQIENLASYLKRQKCEYCKENTKC